MVPLKKGTLKCPGDKTQLHFKQIHGMRIVEEVSCETSTGKKVTKKCYDAYCPTCGSYYLVTADSLRW